MKVGAPRRYEISALGPTGRIQTFVYAANSPRAAAAAFRGRAPNGRKARIVSIRETTFPDEIPGRNPRA